MKKKSSIVIISFLLMFLAQGCLLMKSVSYEIKPDGNGGGTAVLNIEDIRSDAINSTELNEDKKNLFEFMYKRDRKSTRLNSSHIPLSRMPSSA